MPEDHSLLPGLSASALATLLDRVTETVITVDQAWRFLYVNQTAATLLQQPADQLIGRVIWEMFPQVQDTAFFQACHQAMATQQSADFITHFPLVKVWMQIRLFPTPDRLSILCRDITGREAAKRTLRESRERFRMVLETSLDAAYRRDLRRDRYDYMSPVIERITGFTADELNTMTLERVLARIHPDDRPLVEQVVGQTLLGGTGNMEYRFRGKDGAYRWLGDHFQVLPDDSGHPRYRVGVVRDITERQQISEALRLREERFRALTENTSEVVLILSPEGKIIYESPSAERMLGYDIHYMREHNAFDILHPDDVERAQRLFACCLSHPNQACQEEFRFRHANGSWRVLEVTGHNLLHNPAIQGVVINYHDISERRQMEEALARERVFLDTAIEMLPLPLAFLDQQGEYRRQNDASHALMAQLHVTRVTDLQLLDPTTQVAIPAHRRPFVRALQGEVVNSEEYLVTSQAATERLPMLVSAAPIRMEGDIVGAITISEDISAIKEVDRAKDEFLAVLSHELQTPLTSILGWSEMAIDRNTPELLERAMEIVHRNAVRQRRLVDQILDMSRLIHRKIVLETEVTDLRTQVAQAVENMQQLMAQRRLTLECRLAPDPLPILADTTRLQQCISNLLHNSQKFTPPGGCITVECLRDGAEAQLRIHDTGRGIDPETLPTLFTLFTQVDRNERTGGLGLGLSITRGIIELHHGRIWADSPGLGLGSTFHITLPLAEDAATGALPPDA